MNKQQFMDSLRAIVVYTLAYGLVGSGIILSILGIILLKDFAANVG